MPFTLQSARHTALSKSQLHCSTHGRKEEFLPMNLPNVLQCGCLPERIVCLADGKEEDTINKYMK